uniref:Guanylate kinase-like domain-containing protein n=1 Tax=Maylandia zebra TaxID=106582 RepID=A0A3P9CMJ2_9CICH
MHITCTPFPRFTVWDSHFRVSAFICFVFLTSISFVSSLFSQEEDFQEMVNMAQTMETQYSHLFEMVIVNDNLDVAFSELQLALKKVETETHWIPVSWTHS